MMQVDDDDQDVSIILGFRLQEKMWVGVHALESLQEDNELDEFVTSLQHLNVHVGDQVDKDDGGAENSPLPHLAAAQQKEQDRQQQHQKHDNQDKYHEQDQSLEWIGGFATLDLMFLARFLTSYRLSLKNEKKSAPVRSKPRQGPDEK
eukprot:760220-Hanusia_phi.AAC.2